MYCKTVKERIKKCFGFSDEQAEMAAVKIDEVYRSRKKLISPFKTFMDFLNAVNDVENIDPDNIVFSFEECKRGVKAMTEEKRKERFEKQVAKLKEKYGVNE